MYRCWYSITIQSRKNNDTPVVHPGFVCERQEFVCESWREANERKWEGWTEKYPTALNTLSKESI